MKIVKIILFTTIAWLILTISTHKALIVLDAPSDVHEKTLIISSVITVSTILFLAIYSVLQSRFKIPRVSFSIPLLGLVAIIALFLVGIFGSFKEPLIWESVIPTIYFLFPLMMLGYGIGWVWEKYVL